MELNVELNKNVEKNNFLNSVLGKTINTAIDIGLRAILPDLIENQVIDIKNALLQNGLKSGIDTAVNSAINLGKSAVGIVTGNFENMDQVRMAVGNGGIVDTVSNVLDKAINNTYKKGYIDKTVTSIIKNGKNVLLNNISNNIKSELDQQTNSVEKLEKYINNWKEYYNKEDFEGMTKEYNKIKTQLNKVVPLENILKKTKKVKTLHKLIKNNVQNFNIKKKKKNAIENLAQ